VAQLQFTSVAPPLDSPGVGTLAARLLSYAATIGLIDATPATMSYEVVLEAAKKLATATGAGSATLIKLQERGADEPRRLSGLLAELYQALEASPAPNAEWPPLDRMLGSPLLSELLNISASSLERYESSERRTPDDVADRLHFLALTLSDLAGAYNEFGIRRWFERPRTVLRGKSPKEALRGDWDSDSRSARQVRSLAAALSSSPAT
jgi:hypothetical protein